jgi:uncharacterized protein (TIGR00369 family)
MATANDAPGARLYRLWNQLSPLPGGRWLFSRFVGWMAPYTGSIGAVVMELSPGHSRVRMKERARLRQHLRSVHAVALVNLAEMSTGLAMLVALPPGVRGIVVSISMDYLKKARGVLTAECDCVLPQVTEPTDFDVHGRIVDESGAVVATAKVRWRLSPPSASGGGRAATANAAPAREPAATR